MIWALLPLTLAHPFKLSWNYHNHHIVFVGQVSQLLAGDFDRGP